MIINVKYRFPPDFPQQAKDLVMKILKKNPKNRLSLQEIKNHSWLNDGSDKKVVKKTNESFLTCI